MKKIKGLVATFALAGIIMMGVSSANAGVMLSDYTGTNNTPAPCKVKFDRGFLVSDFSATGIINNLIIVGSFFNTKCN